MEQDHIKELLGRFQQEDRWNVNESALFAFAPLDRGLSQRQMSGKRANKFRMTIAFTCNSDGSEKGIYSLLGSRRSLDASVDKAQSHVGFTII